MLAAEVAWRQSALGGMRKRGLAHSRLSEISLCDRGTTGRRRAGRRRHEDERRRSAESVWSSAHLSRTQSDGSVFRAVVVVVGLSSAFGVVVVFDIEEDVVGGVGVDAEVAVGHVHEPEGSVVDVDGRVADGTPAHCELVKAEGDGFEDGEEDGAVGVVGDVAAERVLVVEEIQRERGTGASVSGIIVEPEDRRELRAPPLARGESLGCEAAEQLQAAPGSRQVSLDALLGRAVVLSNEGDEAGAQVGVVAEAPHGLDLGCRVVLGHADVVEPDPQLLVLRDLEVEPQILEPLEFHVALVVRLLSPGVRDEEGEGAVRRLGRRRQPLQEIRLERVFVRDPLLAHGLEVREAHHPARVAAVALEARWPFRRDHRPRPRQHRRSKSALLCRLQRQTRRTLERRPTGRRVRVVACVFCRNDAAQPAAPFRGVVLADEFVFDLERGDEVSVVLAAGDARVELGVLGLDEGRSLRNGRLLRVPGRVAEFLEARLELEDVVGVLVLADLGLFLLDEFHPFAAVLESLRDARADGGREDGDEEDDRERLAVEADVVFVHERQSGPVAHRYHDGARVVERVVRVDGVDLEVLEDHDQQRRQQRAREGLALRAADVLDADDEQGAAPELEGLEPPVRRRVVDEERPVREQGDVEVPELRRAPRGHVQGIDAVALAPEQGQEGKRHADRDENAHQRREGAVRAVRRALAAQRVVLDEARADVGVEVVVALPDGEDDGGRRRVENVGQQHGRADVLREDRVEVLPPARRRSREETGSRGRLRRRRHSVIRLCDRDRGGRPQAAATVNSRVTMRQGGAGPDRREQQSDGAERQ
mmetsp:Transcript_3953/g.12273  ORF Transcript_3953/g.12273 Transcript_3953/m.12273 type:complete len:821 (-) Transcript_3953:483-2945(-)